MGTYCHSDNITFVTIQCGGCGIHFGLPQKRFDALKKSHDNFWCPNGCRRHFVGETKEERLQRELDNQRNRTNYYRRAEERQRKSTAAYKGQVTKVKNRVKNGVCPCCNRHFKNLGRHMQNQHPEFGSESA